MSVAIKWLGIKKTILKSNIMREILRKWKFICIYNVNCFKLFSLLVPQIALNHADVFPIFCLIWSRLQFHFLWKKGCLYSHILLWKCLSHWQNWKFRWNL